MDYSSIPLLKLMKSQLAYLSERQGVLAQNIANADTPGYKAQDVTAPDFHKMLKQSSGMGGGHLAMTLTSPMHITGGAAAGGAFKVAARKNTDELNPDGNNVVIEEEMSKIGQNQADYQKVLNLYGKAVSMFKTAIGSTGG